MATVIVDSSNWNDPSFWSSLTVTDGDTLDLSGLGSGFTLVFDANTNSITISDGTTSFQIGGASNPGSDATVGSGEVSFFDTVIGPDGSSTAALDDDNNEYIGGDGNDTVHTGSGNDTIHGGAGDDNLSGGGDADTFIVSNGFGNDTIVGGETGDDYDTIDLSNLTGAVTVTYTGNGAGTIRDGNGNAITFSEIERLILTDQADAVNASNDSVGVDIEAGAGNDTITDGSGDDSIVGGDGDDYIAGNDGNDTFEGGDGDDDIEGGDGDDSIDGGAGNDFLAGYDVRGLSSHSHEIVTDDGSADTISGGTGNDTILGGGGADSLDGGDGDDWIDAGSGNDTIDAGPGNDSITGGDGDDVFVYNVGDGADTITDFNVGNTGALGDGDTTNNDFIDLGNFYDSVFELQQDYDDDGILNQSNANDDAGSVDYSNNDRFADGEGITFQNMSSSSEFTTDNTGTVCFASGTLIATPTGEVSIEALRPGDLVKTRDNGPQRLVWMATRHLTQPELEAQAKLKPIVLAPQLIGAHTPLWVSPQHGMLMRVDGTEKLVRATHLARMNGGQARVARGCRKVTYFHLLFEDHQVVFANGAASESFYPGPQALRALPFAAKAELLTLFPALASMEPEIAFGTPAREFGRWKDMPQTLRAFSHA